MRIPVAMMFAILFPGGTADADTAATVPGVPPYAAPSQAAGPAALEPPHEITIGGITGVPGDPAFDRRMKEMFEQADKQPAATSQVAGSAAPEPPREITIGGITGVPGDPAFDRRMKEMFEQVDKQRDATTIEAAGMAASEPPHEITIGGITGVPGDPEFDRRMKEMFEQADKQRDAAPNDAAVAAHARALEHASKARVTAGAEAGTGAEAPEPPHRISIGGITGVPGDPELERRMKELFEQRRPRQ
jgi:hypothetical protein